MPDGKELCNIAIQISTLEGEHCHGMKFEYKVTHWNEWQRPTLGQGAVLSLEEAVRAVIVTIDHILEPSCTFELPPECVTHPDRAGVASNTNAPEVREELDNESGIGLVETGASIVHRPTQKQLSDLPTVSPAPGVYDDTPF